MISDVDDDDNGYITVEEFIPLMTQVIHEDKYLEDEILELFVHFGKERSFLSSEALASKLLIASNGALTSGEPHLVMPRELFLYFDAAEYIINFLAITIFTIHRFFSDDIKEKLLEFQDPKGIYYS